MIPDHRRAQARRYDLSHFLLVCILGILSGAHSYRRLEVFMNIHFDRLKDLLPALEKWKRPPGFTTIRTIIHGVDGKELEQAFRKYSQKLAAQGKQEGRQFIGLDGKVLRGSFDHFEDKAAVQLFSAFLTGTDIILAHEEILEQKTNEIPIAQALIPAIGLTGVVYTSDALHCQKKLSVQQRRQDVT